MKKLFFILFFIFFFLIIFSRSAFAQSCSCVSSGPRCEDIPCMDPNNQYYTCVPQSSGQCPGEENCQCSPSYSETPITSCTGSCEAPLTIQCQNLPNTYCTYKCGFFSNIRSAECPYDTQVCCAISQPARNDECVNNCSTSCVFGINLPGFTCKVEASYGRFGQIQACVCYPPSQQPTEGELYSICLGNTECENCINGGGAWTAIGCIQTSDPQAFITWLLGAAIGIAGGIAVILMIFGGLLIILSSGDPQRLQSGKDILTSAIIGLVIIIFSVFILRIIGVEILQIPGFE